MQITGFLFSIILIGCGKIISINFDTLTQAEFLIQKYDYQIFDAIIISAALQAHCDVLYTEDMHNGLVVEDKLRIVNPYL